MATDRRAVAVDHRAGDLRIVGDEGGVELHRRAEVEQHHLAGVRLPQVVREVRVGLHRAELEQFPEHQPLDHGAHRVARGLRDAGRGERADRLAFHEVHRQDAPRGQVGVRARHEQRGLVGHEPGVTLDRCGLGQVVRFLRKLAGRLGGNRRDVGVAGKHLQQAQQRRDVFDVALDRARDTGILDLQREVATVDGAHTMHLADRGRGDRRLVEGLEGLPPALAVFAAEHPAQLRRRHRRGLRAQDRQRLGEFRR